MRIWPRGGSAFLEVGVWRSSCEDCMETKEQLVLRCSCLLVRVIRCGVSAKVLLKATLISGSRLGCFTYGWLTLLEFMGQFMWIVVLSCSTRMAFLTPFPMLRISECWLCLCQNAKFEALQHARSLVISWLCTSNWSCCQAPAQSWANIQTGGHRSLQALAYTATPTRTHTHTHLSSFSDTHTTHTHTHTHCDMRLAQAWFWRRLLASACNIWAGSSCLYLLNLAGLGSDYDSWCRLYDGGMCYLLEVSPVSLVVLAICLALFFIVTHTHRRAHKNTRPVLVATRLGGSHELETRAYILAEPYWTWWRWVTCMCRLLCLLLVWHCRFIVTSLPPTWLFSLPGHMVAGFFFFWQNLVGRGGDLPLVMSVIWRSCAWKYRLSCFKCHLPGTLFSLCFTCSMHTHSTSPLRNLPKLLRLVFSFESLLYERLKQKKKKLVRVLWLVF